MLALLQFRWVGQVREADRDRMRTHVRNAAIQFHEALDGEILRAVMNLQVGAATARDGFSDRYSDRYEAWMTTSAHPQIVADVLLIDADEGKLQLRRWNQATHSFEPYAWPEVLLGLRPQFEQELGSSRAGRFPDRRLAAALDESLVLMPLRPAPPPVGGQPGPPRGVFGFTVVHLDLDYIRTQLLPELAQRYFLLADGDGYRVAVTNAGDPAEVLYRSDPDAPTDPATADASEPLFGFGRGGNPRDRDRRPPNLLRGFDRDGLDDRPDRDGRWLLLAQHQSGSLEAAVTRTRNRNLAIGFGVLLLLTMSVGMLALTTRRAQRLAQQQMEFVAGVSHELRTPIAVIRSAAENLAEGVVGSPDRIKRYGDAIGAEARRLGEMVEHVIQYAGLESGRDLVAHTPLAPATLVDEAISEALPVIRSAGATVERRIADDLPAVSGDTVALRSALQNLIANAVKYGGEDRWVRVRAERVSDAGPHVKFVVEDHGAGIPAEDLPHIFEPFYRGSEAINRQVHGNGLGLSIVKRIVSAHRGRLQVATQPGTGSTFTILLPAVDGASLASLATGGAPVTASDAGAHS
jgi:signal transduction histidine kinase